MSSIAEQFARGVFVKCRCKKCNDCDRISYSGNIMGGMCCFCNDDKCYYGREWDDPKNITTENDKREDKHE